MIDHLLGRPSVSWKRTQVFLVMFFWIWRLVQGNSGGPRILWIRRLNRLAKRFTPWEIIVSTLTTLYAVRHFDSFVGLAGPEPLSRMYSRAYYRATWIITGLDAGILTAMPIRPKWFRDMCSMIFSIYYLVYANEADEKLRKYRAVCTVETLRVTWEKSSHPWLRALSFLERPSIPVVRQILIPRPAGSPHTQPISLWLFFSRPERELAWATDLVLDFPGGGFMSMHPLNHEDRLRRWAVRTGKPVIAVNYGKAPEYPYPWAIEEGFDVYRVLVESKGRAIGMSGKALNIIMSGDSSGGNLVATIMYKILEYPSPLPLPVSLVFNYPALDFNFTSWMTPQNLRVLRSEQSSSNIPGLAEQKDHLSHRSPLSVVRDRKVRRNRSWTKSLTLSSTQTSPTHIKSLPFSGKSGSSTGREYKDADASSSSDSDDTAYPMAEHDKPLSARVRFSVSDLAKQQADLSQAVEKAKEAADKVRKAPLGTRVTMTSRTGYFQDRIISPSMMRAMAILYIGPKQNPDFLTDYYLSPILGPDAHLVKFPPILMTCGEKDPFVDDTVIFAGRIREAKRARKAELLRKNNKLGDSLRMSTGTKDRILQESEEDWVQMKIIEGWGHGYLQMATLMREAKMTIDEIGDWIGDAFATHQTNVNNSRLRESLGSPKSSERRTSFRARSKERRPVPTTTPSTETSEADEALSFIPKKRRTPPNSFSHPSTVDEEKVSSINSFGDKSSSSGSGETMIPLTPPDALAPHAPASGGKNGKVQVPIILTAVDAQSPPVRQPSPKPNSVLPPVLATIRDDLPSRRGNSRRNISDPSSKLQTRTSSPNGRVATPIKAALLDEMELMRRRRQDAVYGISDRVLSSDVEDDGNSTPTGVDRDAYGL